MLPPPPRSTLFPYTTLFRSAMAAEGINLEVRKVSAFPRDVVELQGYDAIVLHNVPYGHGGLDTEQEDRKSTRLNSSHSQISYAVFCLKKKKKKLKSLSSL